MTSTEPSVPDRRGGLFRLRALVPLALVLLLICLLWILFAGKVVERTVEVVGTRLVGARVDVESASVSVVSGEVRLNGLEVTNPDSPFRNMFEVDEVVGNLGLMAILEKKIVIDTLAVRGLRFGTERDESGALPPESVDSTAPQGLIRRQLDQWGQQVRGPTFSLGALSDGAAGLATITPDSLATVRAARSLISDLDNDPPDPTEFVNHVRVEEVGDSSRALLARLEGRSVTSLGVSGARDAVTSLRTNISAIDRAINQLGAADSVADAITAPYVSTLQSFPQLRQEDYQVAARRLNLPQLDTPDLSLSVFGDAIASQLRPVLYWVQLAERYMPPGLDPRRRPGPSRARLAGTDVEFPQRNVLPGFLVDFAEVSLTLDSGTAAGDYLARATGITTEPTVYGEPLEVVAGRNTGGGIGDAALGILLNHAERPLYDTLGLSLQGVRIPEVVIPGIGARMPATPGTIRISLQRNGDSIGGTIDWRAAGVAWSVPEPTGSGLQARVVSAVGRSVAGLSDVQVSTTVGGTLEQPTLSISSNVGRVVATEIRNQVGSEVRRLEASARSKVDSLVDPEVQRARGAVNSVRTDVTGRIEEARAELEALKQQLEDRARSLAPRLPGLPGSR